MKNRKLFIVSFLVVATLIVGVGFAAISGNLTITGNAAFYGHEMLEEDIVSALQFDTEHYTAGDGCEVRFVTDSLLNTTQEALVSVNFYDVTGEQETFETEITFTIVYGSEGDTLPTVTLGALDFGATPDEGTQGEFGCTSYWFGTTPGTPEATATKPMNPGDEVKVTVRVTYTKPDFDGEDPTVDDSYTATIYATIPYIAAH